MARDERLHVVEEIAFQPYEKGDSPTIISDFETAFSRKFGEDLINVLANS